VPYKSYLSLTNMHSLLSRLKHGQREMNTWAVLRSSLFKTCIREEGIKIKWTTVSIFMLAFIFYLLLSNAIVASIVFSVSSPYSFTTFKGLIHFQMKISPSFTHPQAILSVYDFLLSDEHNLRYFNKYPDASKLYNGSEQGSQVAEESASIHIHPS